MIQTRPQPAFSQDSHTDLSNYDDDCETHLLKLVSEQNLQAFEILYHRYEPSLRHYLNRHAPPFGVVDELLNDVMVVLWRDAARVPPSVPLAAWLFGIARHQVLKAWNRRARCNRPLPDGVEEPTPTTPESDLLRREHYTLLDRFLNRLRPEQRKLMELTIYQGLSYEEISRRTHTNVNTIKSRLSRARHRLYAYISEHG